MHSKALINLDRVPQPIGTTGNESTDNFTKALYILKKDIGDVLLQNQNPKSDQVFESTLRNVYNCIINKNDCNTPILKQFETQINAIRAMMTADTCWECQYFAKNILDYYPYTFTNNKLLQKNQKH